MGDKNETKEKIIQAAIKIFGEKGYSGATTIEIAKGAGISEGTIFKYYKTKKELLESVLERIVNEIIPEILYQPFDEIEAMLKEKDIKLMLKEMAKTRVIKANSNINAFRILITELLYHEDLKNQYLEGFVPKMISMLENLYKLGVKANILKTMNPRTAIRSFISMIAFMVIDINVFKTEIDIDKELDAIIDIYFEGMKA